MQNEIIFRQKTRIDFLQDLLARLLLSIPRESATEFLNEFSHSLETQGRDLFPRLPVTNVPEIEAVLADEVEYLKTFASDLVIQQLGRTD